MATSHTNVPIRVDIHNLLAVSYRIFGWGVGVGGGGGGGKEHSTWSHTFLNTYS